MRSLTGKEYREYQEYKATGLTPKQIVDLRLGVYPDDEDRAPLPLLRNFDDDIHLGASLLEED